MCNPKVEYKNYSNLKTIVKNSSNFLIFDSILFSLFEANTSSRNIYFKFFLLSYLKTII